MQYTTLGKLKDLEPCKALWENILADLPETLKSEDKISFKELLNTSNINTLVVALRTLESGLTIGQEFALWNAEQVLPVFENIFPEEKKLKDFLAEAKKALNAKIKLEVDVLTNCEAVLGSISDNDSIIAATTFDTSATSNSRAATAAVACVKSAIEAVMNNDLTDVAFSVIYAADAMNCNGNVQFEALQKKKLLSLLS